MKLRLPKKHKGLDKYFMSYRDMNEIQGCMKIGEENRINGEFKMDELLNYIIKSIFNQNKNKAMCYVELQSNKDFVKMDVDKKKAGKGIQRM